MMKRVLAALLLFCPFIIFACAVPERKNDILGPHDMYINGKPAEVIYPEQPHRDGNKYEYYSNGLIIMTTVLHDIYEFKYLLYNEYNIDDRLTNVYSIHNDEKITVKQYFYDGQLRLFERPYFSDVEKPELEEIIIYDNDKLRYYILLYGFSMGNVLPPQTIEERNERTYHVLFEFDGNGNEISQVKYYGSSRYRDENADEIVVYSIQNRELDSYNN